MLNLSSFNLNKKLSYQEIVPMDTSEDTEEDNIVEKIYQILNKNTSVIPSKIIDNNYRICDLTNKSLFGNQFCVLGIDQSNSLKLVEKFKDPLFMVIEYLKLEYDKGQTARFEFEEFMYKYTKNKAVLVKFYKLSKFIKNFV